MSLLILGSIIAWSACALAITVLAGLVGTSAWTRRRTGLHNRQRSQYIELLKAGIEPSSEPGKAADVVLTDLAVDLLGLVRGDDEARWAERAAKAGVAKRLIMLARSWAARRRLLAAAALGSFADSETRAALTRALKDPNRHVRLTAAMSLAKRGQSPPPVDLIRLLGIGDRETSLLCVMLLAELTRNYPAEVRSLLLDVDVLPAVKAAAAEALAKNFDVAAIPAISGLIIGADPWGQELPRYLGALGDLAHPAGTLAVLHCLKSTSPEARGAAARASGRIGIKAASGLLDGLLDDPVWQVRFESAHALLALGEIGLDRLCSETLKRRPLAFEAATLTLAEHDIVR